MSQLEFVGIINGASADTPIAAAVHVGRDVGVSVYDYSSKVVLSLAPNLNGLAARAVSQGFGPEISCVLNGQTFTFPRSVLEAAIEQAQHENSGSLAIFNNSIPSLQHAASLISASHGGETLVFLAAAQSQGFAMYSYDSSNKTLNIRTFVNDTDLSFAQGISAMSISEVGGLKYLYVASGQEHGVTGYRINDGQTLIPIDNFGQSEGLPVQGIGYMESASISGRSYLIIGASNSSSISVLRVGDDGTLTPTDHVIDGLATRFGGISAMEVIEVGGQVMVLAAGADLGISLFALSPGGELVHMQSIEDNLQFGLDRVSGISAFVVNDRLNVFVTSQGDAGVSQFELDVADLSAAQSVSATAHSGSAGDDMLALESQSGTLDGKGGDDILIDGFGQDILRGGAGRDTFVLIEDGRSDRIEDFDFNQDRLDLSRWSQLYDVSQISTSIVSGGALRLSFKNESLDIFSGSGGAMLTEDFARVEVDLITRMNLSRAPLPEPEPEQGQTIYGTSADDQLSGTAGDDIIIAGAGDDRITPGTGADRINGEAGMDLVDYSQSNASITYDFEGIITAVGDVADDTLTNIEGLVGTGFDDRVDGDLADNHFFGGAGNDRLDGRGGADTIYGGVGDDGLLGRGGDDLIFGGAGNDKIPGAEGNDVLYGGGGNDAIGGGEGDDFLYGGEGNDRIGAGPGQDYLEGGDGNDGLAAGPENDIIYGGEGDDRLAGSYGSDLSFGGSGNDTLGGGYGFDVLYGGAGDDLFGAGHHDDQLYGGSGDDILNAGEGADQLFGGADNDRLNGGEDNDELTGGSGVDTFVFASYRAGERDIILDFEIGIDVLRLSFVPGNSPTKKMANLGIEQHQSDTLITWQDHEILLANVAASDLTSDSFAFVGL